MPRYGWNPFQSFSGIFWGFSPWDLCVSAVIWNSETYIVFIANIFLKVCSQCILDCHCLTSEWLRKWFILTCSSMYMWSKFSLSQPISHQLKSHSLSLWTGENTLHTDHRTLNLAAKLFSIISINSLFDFNPVWSLAQDILYCAEHVTFVTYATFSVPEDIQ